MPRECHQRAHRHAELPDLVGAAELRQVDDEASGEHIGPLLPEQFHRTLGGATGRDQVVDQDTFRPVTASLCISISSRPYSSE